MFNISNQTIMKKLFTLFIGLFCLLAFIYAQQVPRDKVILEIATGTWCPNCPGAAMGADDLIENGKEVGVIEYHNGDIFANTYSNARNSYYNITGYPTAHFDGVLEYVGGSTNQSNYSVYLPLYNQRKAIPSSFTIDIDFTNTGLNYNATVVVTKVASTTSTNMVLHLVLTQSNISYNWQGQDHLNFVERLMVPDQYGTPLDFSGGDVQTLDLPFTMDASWPKEDCELVAFIQDTDTKEILQGAKKNMATPDFDYDVEMLKLYDVPDNNCTGEILPIVTFQNWGAQELTSLTLHYMVIGGEPMDFDWTGSLGFLDKTTVTLDPIYFTPSPSNDFMVYTMNPDGEQDENPTNDTLTKIFSSTQITTYYRVALLLKTDANPQQTTYDIADAAGYVWYTGGPFSLPNHVYKDTFNLYNSDCYRFTIYDSGGDGLEGGYYTLREAFTGGVAFATGSEFTTMERAEFEVDWVGIGDQTALEEGFHIYPNPCEEGTTVYVTLKENENVSFIIYNGLGQIVHRQNAGILTAGEHAFMLKHENLAAGINFVQVKIGERTYSSKILVNR